MIEKTITLALMDPPYESANSTTALRIVAAALQKGIHVNVFAYEGAVNLVMTQQKQHPNPVKNQDVAQANHPTTVRAIQELNGIENPNLIYVGSELLIPRGAWVPRGW